MSWAEEHTGFLMFKPLIQQQLKKQQQHDLT